jgi:predicted permease
MRAGPGFAAERVVTFSVDLERSGYGSEKSRQFARDLLARAQSTRGVMAAGFSTIGLLEGSYWGMEFTVEGFEPKPGEGAGSLMNAVSPGFFTALRVPIVMGRDFTERDQRIQPADEKQQPWRTAIINEAFAREYFAGRNPIGRHVGVGDDLGTPMPIEVIGVAKDTRYGAVREEARPQLFVPAFEARGINNLTLYVRSDAPATAMLGSLRRIVADLDPAVTLYHVGTVDDLVSRSMTNERVIASLSTGFGVLATLLAIVGLYGVMTWLVTQRTREIGMRMALGALASTVAWRVLREAALLVVAGLALAAPTAWWLGRYVQSQLYEVRPGDVATLASAAVLLVVVSALAVLVPARRAAQVDPMSALRQD